MLRKNKIKTRKDNLIISFVITQFIALFFMGITIAQYLCFLITLGTAFSLRMADLKRSRQTIGRF
mgnify:CR=1 FL=1